MAALLRGQNYAEIKRLDHDLERVDTRAGAARIRYYLFHGAPVQRNYAALYFKRREQTAILGEAVAAGAIDAQQAYAE